MLVVLISGGLFCCCWLASTCARRERELMSRGSNKSKSSGPSSPTGTSSAATNADGAVTTGGVEAALEKFGYAFYSKQVRQYRTNDCSTVRRAIVCNVEEYLLSEGIEYDLRSDNARYGIGAISVVVGAGTYLAGLWPFRVPFELMKPFLAFSVVFYNVCAAAMYYLFRYVDTDCFFQTNPNTPPTHEHLKPASPATPANSKSGKTSKSSAANGSGNDLCPGGCLGQLLEGQRVRLRTKTETFSPKITIRAELLNKSRPWYMPATVLHAVEKDFSYGEFFDEEGFIYPPSLMHETQTLLRELMAEKTK